MASRQARGGWQEPVVPLGLLDILASSVGILAFLLILSLLVLGGKITMNYQRLQIITRELPPAFAGTPYQVWLASRGGDEPQRWQIASGALPPGLALDEGTGEITGVPLNPAAGRQWPFTVTVRNTCGHPEHERDGAEPVQLSIAVRARAFTAADFAPLRIATRSLPVVTSGEPYDVSLAATGGLPPYRWALVSGNLPEGLAFSPDGVLMSDPGAAPPPGQWTIGFGVSDAASNRAAASLELRVIVRPPSLPPEYLEPQILTEQLPAGEVGTPYALSLSVRGGVPPYAWSLRWPAATPGGLSTSTEGMLSGVPGQAGEYPVTIAVADAQTPPRTASRDLALTVTPRLGPVEPLQIATSGLPDAEQGAAYRAELVAFGGTPPYVWSARSLPRGLRLEPGGVIAGSATRVGPSSAAVEVIDAADPPARVRREVTLNVRGEIQTPPPHWLLAVLAALALVLLLPMRLIDRREQRGVNEIQAGHDVEIVRRPDGEVLVQSGDIEGFMAAYQRLQWSVRLWRLAVLVAWVIITVSTLAWLFQVANPLGGL